VSSARRSRHVVQAGFVSDEAGHPIEKFIRTADVSLGCAT
jgi:hypothetical protein